MTPKPVHTTCNVELSSVAIGGRIVSVSDEFFAEAYHLIEVEVRLFDVSSTIVSGTDNIYEMSRSLLPP